MMKNGHSSIKTQEAVKRIAHHIPNMLLEGDSVDPNAILLMIIERSGILRQASLKKVDFIHRTFQEYMAACAAKSEGDWGALCNYAPDDQWREVIILASGLANMTEADTLITSLLRFADTKRTKSSYLELLAISCLETVGEISPHVRSEVENRLSSILPPKNKEQVSSLIAAGDIAIPYLDAKPTFSERESVLCIQVLGRIGSRAALEKLSGYASDRRSKVVRALDDTLGRLMPEDVTKSGLSDGLFNSIGNLIHNKGIGLSGNMIYALSQETSSRWRQSIHSSIQHLSIVKANSFSLSILEVLPLIQSLKITGEIPEDLYLLSNLEFLTLLDLRNTHGGWPEFKISPLIKIQTLRLMSQTDEWPYLSAESFPYLLNLHLCFVPRFKENWEIDWEDIESMTKFPTLRAVHLAFPGHLPSLSPLSKLPNLETIEVSTNSENFPEMLVGIDELRYLKNIIINVDDLTPRVTGVIKDMKRGMLHCAIVVRKGWSPARW
jgi:hypothetical protein